MAIASGLLDFKIPPDATLRCRLTKELTMKVISLTMAQALIKFIDNQYLLVDGHEHKFVEGIFAIFGHGNVTGLGEALEYGDHHLQFIRGNNEQGIHRSVLLGSVAILDGNRT
jgi:hypothetical protein